jgi:SAM-dependent methyltransferase
MVCPYCGAAGRALVYRDVQDWSFRCAPGKWDYWTCARCEALYLDPRPTKESIGRAYTSYYTHGASGIGRFLAIGKTLIRNLCYFAWYGITLQPRLAMPKFMFPTLAVFRPYIAKPSFIVRKLNTFPKGRIVDVGCGNGMFLDFAKQLGWHTLGIELDPVAVEVARASGHEVIHGTYEACSVLEQQFDCVICSHVLEHVHAPLDLLVTIFRALRTGGSLLLTLPNASSIVRQVVQENWRGLEAPRHLAIPSFDGLLDAVKSAGFEVEASFVSRLETLDASLAIARQRNADMSRLRMKVAAMLDGVGQMEKSESDFINLVLRKPAAPNSSPERH